MKTLMRNGRDRRSENPFLGHARKERVSLFGTDQRITSGPAATRLHSKAEYMIAPERFADSQIPLAPRAPSIHDFRKIGRITTAGVISEFLSVPMAGSSPTGPLGVTTGPDGALWFTESFANQIARCALTTTNSHDFNADGKSDITWRDTSGNAAVWLMNGAQVARSAAVGTAPTMWSIVGKRDFNGDGTGDIIWHDGSGNVAIWLMNGAQVTQSATVGTAPTSWSIVGTADFNGDGKSDILWRDGNGNVAIWLMNGAQVAQSAAVGSAPTNWL